MSLVDKGFNSLSELKLWYSSRNNVAISLADMQEVIPLRWVYFKENWEFIVETLKSKLSSYAHPDLLNKQIIMMSELIRIQRHAKNTRINPFSNKDTISTYYSIWENIPVASIPLTREESSLVENKLKKVSRFIKNDFLRIREDLTNARDEIADTIGLSDVEYDLVFDRSAVAKLRDARILDITNMQTFQQSIKTVDFILANTGSLNTVNVDPFALARANANNPDVNIQTGLSGQLVRFFFGDSLQALATRYLGNPDRWLEIAIANGLRPPYVDEIGEAVPLISNGSNNQVNLSATDVNGHLNREKFYVNQVIFLQSATVKFSDQRTIIGIKEIPVSGELVLELSGEADMDKFKTVDDAYIRVFKPNTINSSFYVLIPSPTPIKPQPKETPFFLLSKGEDEKRAGVDILLDDNNDLVFSSTGDLQLSYGLANALQAMKIKMVSEIGQLPRHPSFGLPAVVGKKMKDPQAIKSALITGINDLVNSDTRFDRIETLNVRLDGTSAIISIVVRMAGTGSLIPISFKVNIG